MWFTGFKLISGEFQAFLLHWPQQVIKSLSFFIRSTSTLGRVGLLIWCWFCIMISNTFYIQTRTHFQLTQWHSELDSKEDLSLPTLTPLVSKMAAVSSVEVLMMCTFQLEETGKVLQSSGWIKRNYTPRKRCHHLWPTTWWPREINEWWNFWEFPRIACCQ